MNCTAGVDIISLLQQHLPWASSNLYFSASSQTQRSQELKYLKKHMGYGFRAVQTSTLRIQNTNIHWLRTLQTWLQKLLQLGPYTIIVNQVLLSSCSFPSAF